MKVKILVALVLCVAVLSAGCQGGPKKPTQKEAATQQWNRARAQVLGSLARNQLEAANLDGARQSIGEAIRLDPESAALRITAAKLALEQSQLEVADQQLTLARKLDPKNAEAEYLNGVVYQRWQKNDQAYECYLRASEKDPNEIAYVMARAEMLVAMNCTPQALEYLNSKLTAFEHSPVLQHTIGQLQMDQGQYADAVKSLHQASVLAPDDNTIREHLAMAYFQDKRFREAGDLYGRLLKVDPNSKRAELWVALGECQLHTGRAVEARNSFDTATQLNPSLTAAWLSLAKVTLQLGDIRRADTLLRKVLALDADSAEAHLMLGYVRLRDNKLADALREFQKASALDQSDPVSLCMVGYVLERSGKPEEAMRYYGQALKLKPNNELASRLMASVGE